MINQQGSIHGTLLAVFGVGVLLTGKPSSGKSSLALSLLDRGHKLVADDLVLLDKKKSALFGYAPKAGFGFLHSRDLGMLDIAKLFSDNAIQEKTEIHLIINLDIDDSDTGISNNINLPLITSPPSPVMVEVAIKNYLLQKKGYNAATEFKNMLRQTDHI
ncbi:MAG: hypothetical protein JXR42_05835 [Gammaproteobacteria bacterium]|nr:hypothetical protein [Gammaproteobacteria bacterium]